MKKATIIIALFVLLTATTALAADGVLYSDDELGFSFEMPSDFEYYGDVSQEAAEILDAEKIVKQPVYIGYDSNISVTYTYAKEEFEPFKNSMPYGMKGEELDFYLVPEKSKEDFEKRIVDDVQDLGMEYEVLSSEWVDSAGKLGLYINVKGHNSELGLDLYQGNCNFMYKDYFIAFTYTMFDIDGTLTSKNAKAQFDECFNTLKFDVVPSNKDAKFKSGTVLRLEALAEVIIGLVSVPGIIILLVWLYKKRKNKYAHKL